MSAESDYKCDKCGTEWCAIPPSKCPTCSSGATTVDVFLRGKSGQTLQGTFTASLLPKMVEFFCQTEAVNDRGVFYRTEEEELNRKEQSNDSVELAIQLCAATKTHQAWLAVVRFGLHTLLDDQLVLVECVFLEAERERERKNDDQSAAIHAWEILEELELKITTSDDA